MAEWSNAAVLKTVVRLTGPGVRIPLPPLKQKAFCNATGLLLFRKAQAIAEEGSRAALCACPGAQGVIPLPPLKQKAFCNATGLLLFRKAYLNGLKKTHSHNQYIIYLFIMLFPLVKKILKQDFLLIQILTAYFHQLRFKSSAGHFFMGFPI